MCFCFFWKLHRSEIAGSLCGSERDVRSGIKISKLSLVYPKCRPLYIFLQVRKEWLIAKCRTNKSLVLFLLFLLLFFIFLPSAVTAVVSNKKSQGIVDICGSIILHLLSLSLPFPLIPYCFERLKDEASS